MTAGIDHSEGTYIALIDGDLQNDPSDIPFMIKKMKFKYLNIFIYLYIYILIKIQIQL